MSQSFGTSTGRSDSDFIGKTGSDFIGRLRCETRDNFMSRKKFEVISTSYAVMEAYLKLRHVLVNRNESRRKLFLTVLKVCYPVSLTDFSHKVSNKIST